MISSILLPGIGDVVDLLSQNDLEISLPSDALALLRKDATGYAFIWEICYYDEETRYPDLTGVSLDEIVARIIALLFLRVVPKEGDQQGRGN